MKKVLAFLAIILSVLVFGCGDTKTSSEKVESQTTIQPDTSVSTEVDSLLQQMDQSRQELKQSAEETKKAVDDLLKEF